MASLDPRSRDILYHLVEEYVETGEPVGSRTLSRRLGLSLSPATIRNVMADLEEAGFLFSPHTSAGRLPTQAALRFFLDAFLNFDGISLQDQKELEKKFQGVGKSLSQTLDDLTLGLSGLSQCAGLVLAPKTESTFKHIEFVFLNPGRAMVVLITESGTVENRIIEIPLTLSSSHLTQATNYLNDRLVGKDLVKARLLIENELREKSAQIDDLVEEAVQKGFISWEKGHNRGTLIVKGQSQLLRNVREIEELENLQHLFEALDTEKELLNLLDATIAADGVQIFVGSENKLFELSGCAVVLSPYRNGRGSLLGAIGVIGPTYMNYRRIIPMVDYTARLVERLVGL
jgi:heat-inducible transcriptional repressor